MLNLIEKESIGIKRVKGLSLKLAGRLRGASRARHKVLKWGRLDQQNQLSNVEQACRAIFTKFGVLSLKVICAKERVGRPTAPRFILKTSVVR